MIKQKKRAPLPSKSKKILFSVLAIILAATIAAGCFFAYDRKRELPSSAKNAISMGTVITSKIFGDYAAVRNEDVISVIQQLDSTISWRNEGSAVAKINAGNTVKLTELAQVIAQCVEISQKSGGAFDITVGAVAQLWDIGGDNERIPSAEEISKVLKTVDYSAVKVNSGAISVKSGQQLDLGAVGKGWACDMIKSYFETTDCPGAVVSVGGSILCYGSRNKAGSPWRVAIKHPRSENEFLGTIEMNEGFVSTSGDYERYFENDGKRYHHILDARTGYPADSGLISVTVVADSGLLSDALSTACFILGLEEGTKLAESFGAAAIFVDSDMNVTTVGDINFKQ